MKKIILALLFITTSSFSQAPARVFGSDLVCYQVITNQLSEQFLVSYIQGFVSGFNAASSMVGTTGDRQIPLEGIIEKVKGRCLEKPSEYLITVIAKDAFPRKY